MVAKWDMAVAWMLARILADELSPVQHALKCQVAIGTRSSRVSIFGVRSRMAREQPCPSQEMVR